MDTTDFRLFGRKKPKPEGEDTTKLGPFTAAPPTPAHPMVISHPTDDEFYKNNHSRNGIAVVLNHKHVKGMKPRGGTEKDCASVQATFLSYGFDVRVFDDLSHKDVRMQLNAIAAEDHSSSDCFVLVVMSHGEEGRVCASDTSYPVEELWQPFMGDKCKSLIDKPKIFFVQACRGKQLDNPVMFRALQVRSAFVEPVMMNASITYAIPSTADILVMYATFDKHYSFRNVDYGSWFIQSLCHVLNVAAKRPETRSEGLELLRLLTAVNRKVAYEYQSYSPLDALNEKKEMPNFMSTLTKTFYLKVKPQPITDGDVSVSAVQQVSAENAGAAVIKTETDHVEEFIKEAKAQGMMYC